MSKNLVWNEERQIEADRQYNICKLEALMMDLETMQMFPDVDKNKDIEELEAAVEALKAIVKPELDKLIEAAIALI